MLCVNCRKKIKNNFNFCNHCGVVINSESVALKQENRIVSKRQFCDNKNRETVEEYLAKTNIKDKEQARKYLNQLRVLFVVIFFSMIALKILNEIESSAIIIFFVLYIVLWVYFIIFCMEVLAVERLPKYHVFWCIFFAPISWLHFYPFITNPLKIITGKKQPPICLSEKEKKNRIEANNKFWKKFWIMIVIISTIVLLAIFLSI